MKRFIVQALFLISCCTQLHAIDSDLQRKLWFVCPWEKVQGTFDLDQQILDLNMQDLVYYKKNLPVWVTNQWVTQQVACLRNFTHTEFLLDQEDELDASSFFNQQLQELFAQALQVYKNNASGQQLKPFDVFVCSLTSSDEISEDRNKIWYCMLVPTSMRNESKIMIEGLHQHIKPIILERGSDNSYAGVLFLALVYGVLAGVAYVFEG